MLPSSPTSPTRTSHHRRRSSNLSNQAIPINTQIQSRRSSLYSPTSRRTSRTFPGDGTSELQSPGGDDNGLGSLADELADAWEEDEAVDENASELNNSQVDGYFNDRRHSLSQSTIKADPPSTPRDSGIGVESPKLVQSAEGSPTSRRRNSKTKHSRKHSTRHSQYDGSQQIDIPEHGHSSTQTKDSTNDEIPASLKASMADIEALAKGPSNGSSDDPDTIERTLALLKDLMPQSNLETHTIRLITAHNSLITNLAHQTRTVHSLTYALLSPLSPPPDPDTIDTLLPLLSSTLVNLPQPSVPALSGLANLGNSSRDAISSLTHLSDTLHLSRQTTGTATRRLKAAREIVADMRREDLAGEVGVKFIEDNGWGRRLAQRECKGVCDEVVGGFEEVCNGYRERLMQSAEVGAS